MDEYTKTLLQWRELKDQIRVMQDQEKALREGLFNGTFPTPEEGTNTYVLPDGSQVKGTYKLNRKLLPGWEKKLPKALRDRIIKTKHELSISSYRELSDEELELVDEFVVATPGLPTLDFIPAKGD